MKYRESEITELKKSTSEIKEAIISMSAMLNKDNRGELYFGIKNDGSVVLKRKYTEEKLPRKSSQKM